MTFASTSDPHPEVPEFVVMTLDGSRHPALNGVADSGVVYHSASNQLQNAPTYSSEEYKEFYGECTAPANELIATANKFLKKQNQPLIESGDLTNWEDVENSMVSACNTLDALSIQDHNTKGFTGKIKSAFRAVCQRAEVGLTFVSMVPDEVPCGAVLCGGLKAVFTALQRSHDYREEVYKAIEDIPYIMKDHALRIHIHIQDEELHRRNAGLYVALFRLIQHILVWFIKNRAVTGIKLLVSPQSFTETLKGRLADVKTAVGRFEAHVLKIRNQRSDKSIEEQHWIAYTVGKTREEIALIGARCQALEKFAQFLQPIHDEAMRKGARKLHRLEMGSYGNAPNVESLRKDLLCELDYDEYLLYDDCEALLSVRKGLGNRLDGERILEFQNHPQLQAWMSLDSSSLLLVDGGCEVSSSSEISYVAAQVMEYGLQLSKQPQNSIDSGSTGVTMIPLAFFCSRHRNRRRDIFGTPEGLAKALLSQLIDQVRAFGAKELQACRRDLSADDIESLCKEFRRLIKKLPASVIIVLVVEGIDILTGEKTRDALRYVVRSLIDTHGGNYAATLKFLFTCTTLSERVGGLFDEGDILRIPRLLRSQGSYRSLMWKDSESLGALGGA
ncbi:uncharacterized protein F4822DRAFT_15199 [Hypoxylon trugodes]|uniref:uncharacterized protein n=1 Tax=Hypoxylon trugodes TaxID=326681 RepID=UPI00219C55B9|nr:uncharacterized protein F4822DRAFT_15199 [Hypoxylon trugodes]KAI1393501.1 hypothetical protein F4822DRAFT_15199 [Hypoxylon trugodes]